MPRIHHPVCMYMVTAEDSGIQNQSIFYLGTVSVLTSLLIVVTVPLSLSLPVVYTYTIVASQLFVS